MQPNVVIEATVRVTTYKLSEVSNALLNIAYTDALVTSFCTETVVKYLIFDVMEVTSFRPTYNVVMIWMPSQRREKMQGNGMML